ncbi:MAG TPA: SDR family oxidoreductase [Candidatus Elarobacter sp.]|nr:SDR family oxidoreductase [Candidatus Elarobacter sp.]
MRNVLVAGGAGGVGEGIVRALLAATDVRVIVTSRRVERLAQLRDVVAAVADPARLIGIVGNAGEPRGAAAIAGEIRAQCGALDVAIPSLGGWWEGGPLLDVDAKTWDAVRTEMLDTHVAFAQAFIPELLRQPGAVYLAIGGGAAFFPVPNSSIVSIAAAAQVMLTRVLAAELADRDVRILELVVNGPVRTREWEAVAQPDWITADDVGGVVAELVRTGETHWPALRRDGPLLVMNPKR